MGKNEEVQKYMMDAWEWLKAAELSVKETPSPAAYDALHAMELAAKACLIKKTGGEYRTHNVAGEFGKYFREEIGKEICKELSKKLANYSIIRYPGTNITEKEAREIFTFAEGFVETCSKVVE